MAIEQKIIYVYENFSGETPQLLGTLFVDHVRGKESYSFEYEADWLKKSKYAISLDPDLQMFAGRQYPLGDKDVFGIFADSSPDRWGRMLMTRRERIIADQEDRKPRKLLNSDFLLGVYDETRMGAIRFKTDKDGPFLSNDDKTPTPPWTSLRTLEEAARQFENDESGLEQQWVKQLIKPGSSLGGARPKATVRDTEGNLWIAKFPSKHDEFNVGAWEKVVHDLAKMCELNVPESKLTSFSKYGGTFLVKRFDRDGDRRIHFASAMTMLGKQDGASAADGTSYLDIVSFIKSNGAQPKKDLVELWKRIVFSMAVSNTDDHLRNHGFILTKNGWCLSPMYDVNPIPEGYELSLCVNEDDPTISIELAVDTASYFDISKKDAETMAKEIVLTVRSNWEKTAEKCGFSRAAIERMRPAFDECYKLRDGFAQELTKRDELDPIKSSEKNTICLKRKILKRKCQ